MGHSEDDAVHKIPYKMKTLWQNQLKFLVLVWFTILYWTRYKKIDVRLVQCPFKKNCLFAVSQPTLENLLTFVLFCFFSISGKKIFWLTHYFLHQCCFVVVVVVVVFFFFFLLLFFAFVVRKTWGIWKIWVNMNIWKAWMLKLECFFRFRKKGFHTHGQKKKKKKKNLWPTLIFCYITANKHFFTPKLRWTFHSILRMIKLHFALAFFIDFILHPIFPIPCVSHDRSAIKSLKETSITDVIFQFFFLMFIWKGLLNMNVLCGCDKVLLRGYCTPGPYFWRLCAFS